MRVLRTHGCRHVNIVIKYLNVFAIPHCSVLLCKTGSQQACVTASTPVKISASYKIAVTQQHCRAALLRAKCILYCSVLLCKTGWQQACVNAIAPVQICCSYRCAVTQHQMHCSTGFGKMHSPLFSAALQNRLTAGLCHCNCTCANLLFI